MNPDVLRLRTPIEVPPTGASVRVATGNSEMVFEPMRGGYTVLWHAGREARRHVLGLTDSVQLTLELRAPVLPLRMLLRETLTLVPGARLHGYVQVPLVPTLCWWRRHIHLPTERLIEFTPPSLSAEWDNQRAAIFTCTSSWFVRYPVHGGEARATVPVRLRNDSDRVCSPEHLPLMIQANELIELRAGIGAAPRRLTWDGVSWRSTVRRASEVVA